MKTALIFVFDGFADWEPSYLCSELTSSGDFSVKTFSFSKEPVKSMGGFTVLPDYSIDELPEDYAFLMLTGGTTWSKMINNWKLNELVDNSVERGIVVGAICDATNFLAEHGILDTVIHTGNTVDYMKANAPHYGGEQCYVDKQVASDKNIVTANGSAAVEFAYEVLKLLRVKTDEALGQWFSIFKKGYFNE